MKLKPDLSILPFVFIIILIISQACAPTRSLGGEERREITERDTTLAHPGESTYRFRPGDEIEIVIWEQPGFNTLTTVSRLGTITMPLVGEIVVAGRTQEELRRDLERELAEYIRGEIILTISVRNTENLVVSVLGMVDSPDNYPVVDQTSIFRILSTAGGPTENANMKKVKLYRQTGPEDYVTLNLLEYLDSGQMNSPAIVVRPGDIVYVPKQENVVREMSEFLRDVVVLFGIFRVFN